MSSTPTPGSDPATYVFFWSEEPEADGGLGPSCLSQWWPARFTADGQDFVSAEHYMMWRKARLFDDRDAAAAVLSAATPREAKAIGRSVSGYDGTTWRAHRVEVVTAGSMAKFGADDALGDYLRSTGDAVLVEASPDDEIWGIGLRADHPDAARPDRWPGLNLLGSALMEARARLSRP